jgi:Ca-activated chloride channel family protein
VSGPERKFEVDLVLFRNAAEKPKRFVLSGTDAGPLVAELEKVQYDGGTQIASVSPLIGGQRPDFYMLFTDGLSNFGREEPKGLDAPVYIFSADPTANHPFLHHLAMTAGGRYFNLAQLRDAEVVPAIGRAAFSFLGATSDAGQVAGIYPELPQPVAGRLTVAGKLTGEQATVTLSYGVQGKPTQKRTFKVSRSQAAEGSLLRRLWAQKKLADLMVFQERNEKEIVALGKQFGMVTPFTSLIVLDSLEQYVEHEIAPPKSLPAMREEYMRRIDTIEFQKKKEKADKIELVLKMWAERVKWWESEFKYPADFKYKEPAGKAKDGAGALGAGMLPRQWAAPPPAAQGTPRARPSKMPAGPPPAGAESPRADFRMEERAVPADAAPESRPAPFSPITAWISFFSTEKSTWSLASSPFA